MPAVPETKAGWTNGVDALNTTNLNAYLRDPIAFLMRPPHANLRQTATQAIANGVTTAVAFNTEDVDTDVDGVGGHSTTTTNSRYTARYAGWYQLSGGVCFASNATGYRFARWLLNGAAVPGSEVRISATATSITQVSARTVEVYLNVGDYVELGASQSTGASLSTSATDPDQSSMTVRWVSL